jgi:phosphatidylserine decarboxylase
MRTLLYDESPEIGILFTVAPMISYFLGYLSITILLIVILIFLLYFYRDYPIDTMAYKPYIIISPAYGKITDIIETKNGTTIISIFLSPLDVHTQVYPISGIIIYKYYDNTGKFDLVVKRSKCRENEKMIQKIRSSYNNKIITVTQIAGFLPRRISTNGYVGKKVRAGEYLGIIKFGSRVDLEIPGTALMVKIGDTVKAGEPIAHL